MSRIEIPNIQFVHIAPEDWLQFKELDPLDRLELVMLPGAFAIGAYDMSEKEPLDIGLMVVLQEQNRYVLEWLCVDEDHRELEIGGAFLAMLFDMSLERGFKEVAVRITSELKADMDGYFREHFFEEEEEAPDFYRVKVADFFKDAKQFKMAADFDFEPVRSLTSAKRNQVLEYISNCGEKFSIYDGQLRWEYVDGDISFVSFDKNEAANGVFICMTQGINYYPLLLAAETPIIEEALIGHSIKALKQQETDGYMLSTFCRSKDMSDMTKEILQGKGGIHQKLLVAETDRFLDLI